MIYEKLFEMVPKVLLRNLTLCCCVWAVCASTSRVLLRDNGYEGVVVALDDQIPPSMCQDVIQGLEEVIRSASSVIFVATRGRASFRSVNVLVPSSWSPSSCPTLWNLQEAISETWDGADLRVTQGKHPRHGARPWGLHTKGCGQTGDYISMGHELLLVNDTLYNAGRLLAQEWLKYRYGVFEEAGWVVNPVHPSHYRSSDGHWVPNACANVPLMPNPSCHPENSSCPFKIDVEGSEKLTKSFMAFPELSSVKELCDEGTHNSQAPTRHNFLCNGKSVWEVMRASPDFQNNRNVEGGTRENEVTFQYVRSHTPRIVLLVDDSSVMNIQNRWDFMRKAVRKFITYDIPDGYSVGLVVFNSFPSTRYPLTPLVDGSTREKVGSALPRNPSVEYEKNRCVTCGIREAMKLIFDQGVGGHIVMVAAGGSSLSEDEILETSQLLKDAHVSLHAILYPLAEKYPSPNSGVELLAARSGGDTFIVRDEGLGDDSKLSMYYNLLDSFYNTLLVVSGQSALPVKIHSSEHPGGKIKVSQGSFVMDPTLGTDTAFSIFYYDVTHVGNQVHLINPKGQVIDTANMQKEDNNINMITVHLVEVQVTPGLWHYKVENRADAHQALYVQVTSRPRPTSRVPSVSVRSWTSHSLVNASIINQPLAIFAEVRAGLMGIEGAKAVAILQNLDYTVNGTLYPPLRIRLVDNGFAGPDMAKGDGVYSRYIPGLVSAKYTITVQVEGEIGGHRFTRQSRLGIVDVIGMPPLTDNLSPSRVVDLRAVVLPDTINQISFTWTAPGDDFDFGTADRYVVFSSNRQQELVEGGGIMIEEWSTPLESSTIQQYSIEWEHYETVYYFTIVAVDESGNTAALSNIVSVYIPTPPTTTVPPLSLKPTAFSDRASLDEEGNTAPILAHFNTHKLAVIFGCIGGFIIVILAVVCYCAVHHRQHQKASPSKSHDTQDTYNINVTVASKGVEFPEGKDAMKDTMKREYVSSVESWSASDLLSNHHDENMSSRSDDNSDHSTSTKKSYGGSSDRNDYLIESGQYPFQHTSYPLHYRVPSDGYPTPTKGYPGDSYPPPSEAQSYISSQPSDSFLSVSCDILPSTHGPPSYMPYPCYDTSLRSNKVPPPIPPKPKVLYTPEPYSYDRHSLEPHSSVPSVSSEKRVRNVTMV